MKWDNMMDILAGELSHLRGRSADGQAEFSDVRLLSAETDEWEPSVCYIVNGRCLDRCARPAIRPVVLLYHAEHLTDEWEAAFENWAELREDVAAECVLSKMQRAFQRERDMDRRLLQLSSMVAGNVGLKRIINFVGETYDRPVFITNHAYEYIAMSDNCAGMEIPAIGESLAGRREQYRNTLDKVRMYDRLVVKNQDAIVIPNGDGRTQFVASPIMLSGIMIGRLSVFDSRKDFPVIGMHYLRRFSDLIALELQKNDFYRVTKGNACSYCLSALLQSGGRDCNLALERLAVLGYTVKEVKYLVKISFANASAQISHVGILTEQIAQLFRNSIYTVQEDSAILLMTRGEEELISGSEISYWEEFFSVNGIAAGISSPFREMSDIARCRDEAEAALELGESLRPERPVRFYEKLRIQHMISMCQRQTDPLRFCYPPLIKLLEDDREQGTQLARTLYFYLKDRDSGEVSKRLFIHRNTLFYRLNKIKEQLHCDYNRGDDILQILLSFEILKAAKLFDPRKE